MRRRSLERRVVWLLGSPRSGTTWLLNLLGRRPQIVKIDEPGIGAHLGAFRFPIVNGSPGAFGADESLLSDVRSQAADYFFADAYADVWRPELRRMILARFAAHLNRAGKPRALCLVKEPHGAQAAGLLLDACPDSRLLWLLRDGRDVVDSMLDAAASGGWGEHDTRDIDEAERLRFVEDAAHLWLLRTEKLERAYERIAEPRRLLVRYEAARSEPAAELERMLDWLGVPATREEIQEDADVMSFERIPAELRGKGRFARSARPGAWRDNLSEAEHSVMERVMGAKLREHGYA